jgi:hypothetical protein
LPYCGLEQHFLAQGSAAQVSLAQRRARRFEMDKAAGLKIKNDGSKPFWF